MLSDRDQKEIARMEEALSDKINAAEALMCRDMNLREIINFFIHETAMIQWNINRLHVVTRTGLNT